ncbi:accessory gene regulator ArgB-like protein [Paenibacillus sp. sgz500992]|uniref:accessory gene regulator ArgB-like protein n=1 Tax=Paenibacillus sp. sgz500992 TaxID=3242476 RepID=UPI0036D2E141
MIDRISERIAYNIKKVVPDHPASQAVLKYALEVVLNVVFIIVITLAISLLTGNFSEALTILVSFALLRQSSGGVHLKSGVACVIFTTTLFTVLSFINVNLLVVQVMNAISFLIILWLAPIGIEKQTRIPKRHYPKLKIIGLVLVATNVIICSSAIAVSYFAQSLSLLIARKEVK